MHPALPYTIASALIGIGIYGVLARRNAVLVLIGVELLLGGAGLILVTASVVAGTVSGALLALFVVTIAAAEVVVALAVLVLLRITSGHIDIAADEAPRWR